LEAIFRNNAFRSVTLVQMEVPCCSNLAKLVLAALERSGARVAVERVVAARTGEIITSEKLA
ncbi:MAG: ferredoxin, partial [Desulfovibrionaceae bacterium]